MKNTVTRVSAPDTTDGTKRRNAEIAARKREEDRPKLERRNPNASSKRQSLPEMLTSKIPDAGARDSARMVTHGLARTYRIPATVFRPPNPTARDDIPEIVSMDRRGEFPPVVLGGSTYSGYVETPEYGGYKYVRESITPDGKWKTDKEIYGSDAIPFDLKGGNSRTRLDAKGGQSADVRAATKGGDGGNETQVETLVQGSTAPVSDGGPRIAVNPAVFHDKRDALCVAMNEAYRIVMEANGFEPVSEPTDKQREFFSDTAYREDELMLRRTILARICTFDTSVADPTDEQLQEAVEFLETVMEIGAPQNEWEQSVVQRTHDILAKSVGMPREDEEPENPAPADVGSGTKADEGGGETDDDEIKKGLDAISSDFRESIDKSVETEINKTTDQSDSVDTSHIKYGPQTEKPKTMDDVGKAVAARHPQVELPGDDKPQEDKKPKAASESKEILSVRRDSMGRPTDAQGRVISERAAEKLAAQEGQAGQEPEKVQKAQAGNQGKTEANQNWDERRAASTEAYLERKMARELRRVGDDGGDVSDRTADVVARLVGKYGEDAVAKAGGFKERADTGGAAVDANKKPEEDVVVLGQDIRGKEITADGSRKIRGRDIRGNPIYA